MGSYGLPRCGRRTNSAWYGVLEKSGADQAAATGTIHVAWTWNIWKPQNDHQKPVWQDDLEACAWRHVGLEFRFPPSSRWPNDFHRETPSSKWNTCVANGSNWQALRKGLEVPQACGPQILISNESNQAWDVVIFPLAILCWKHIASYRLIACDDGSDVLCGMWACKLHRAHVDLHEGFSFLKQLDQAAFRFTSIQMQAFYICKWL